MWKMLKDDLYDYLLITSTPMVHLAFITLMVIAMAVVIYCGLRP